MAPRIEKTLTEGEWLGVIKQTLQDPTIVWRVEGDDGYVREGRLSNWPSGPPREWDARALFVIDDTQLLVGSVRRMRRT